MIASASIVSRGSVREGYLRAREVARSHARSFFLASFLLFGERRRAAYALYAFCRRLDDLVDGGVGALPAPASTSLAERLAGARRVVAGLYRGLPGLADPRRPPHDRSDSGEEPPPWDPAELAAFQDCIRTFRIPERPFQELISGMEMDLTRRRYACFAELDLYCYRVAGVVGEMMVPVLGCSDEVALGPAADMGRAMQLTNILRDVGEDLARDRIYLPQDELRARGLTEDDLRRGTVDGRFVALMRDQIARARALYARAASGIPYLTGPGSRRMVTLMAALYGDILTSIEARGYDVFRGRAYVRPWRKAGLVAATLLAPGRVLPRATVAVLPPGVAS